MSSVDRLQHLEEAMRTWGGLMYGEILPRSLLEWIAEIANIREVMMGPKHVEQTARIMAAARLKALQRANSLYYMLISPTSNADMRAAGEQLKGAIQLRPSDFDTPLANDLHPVTQDLVNRFAEALAVRLAKAQREHGYTDNWARDDWMDECRQKLAEHAQRGDPLNVAAYTAFLWHHGQTVMAPYEHRREKDRQQFGDPDFNRWLDDGVADGGFTVYDMLIGYRPAEAAWSGWCARPSYDSPAEAITIAVDGNQHYQATAMPQPDTRSWPEPPDAEMFAARNAVQQARRDGATIEQQSLDDPLSGWHDATQSIEVQGYLWDTYDYRVKVPQELCGCGQPVKYEATLGGMACNKYARCKPGDVRTELADIIHAPTQSEIDCLREKAGAWSQVYDTLDEVCPGWCDRAQELQRLPGDMACDAIKALVANCASLQRQAYETADHKRTSEGGG